jgi:hypothetical protein
MPTQHETDERRPSMDEAQPAAAGSAATPVASGEVSGNPVGVVGEVGMPPVRPAPDDDRDPAEVAFERLTGHKTDERPPSSTEGDSTR